MRRDYSKQQGQGQGQGQKRPLQCSKGCGHEIYFDVNNKTSTGKWRNQASPQLNMGFCQSS